jgi:hypothetical protein
LYKGYYSNAGTGADVNRDQIPFDDYDDYKEDLEVARLYTEFCPGGDIYELMLHFAKNNLCMAYIPVYS